MKALWAVMAVVVVGCGVSSSDAVVREGDESSTDDSFELSTTKDTFLIARRDMRRCVSPLCGGYWVKDLNSTMQERYVSGFDFTGSGLTDDVQAQVSGAPDFELVLFGRLGPKERTFDTRPLLVAQAYRGMPGKTFLDTDKFYSVSPSRIACFTTPCANLLTTRLNRTTGHTMATDVSVAEALAARVDEAWLQERIITGRAVIAGRVVRQNGHVTVEARQVFVQLPERIRSCPRVPPPSCGDDQIAAWEHTTDRCIVPAGCTAMGVCAPFEPTCDEGYTLVSWMNLCPRYACEPSFLH